MPVDGGTAAGPSGPPSPARRLSTRTVRIATRGSPLALRQTELVVAALVEAVPGLDGQPVVVRTTGDRLSAVSLDRIGGQGVFVGEVQAAVLEGRADLAVHSAKDLPPVTAPGLVLTAVPQRADPRDALVGRALDDLGTGAAVATGSARRRAQLANARPDLTFVELRGNMGTRLAKLDQGGADAVVVAAAALDRLGWTGREAERIAPSLLLPQVGQGALAVECRQDDFEMAELTSTIDHPASRRALEAERAVLAALGASCSVPVAAWAHPEGNGLLVEAMVASGEGRVLVRSSRRAGPGQAPDTLGRALADQLLGPAGGSLVAGWGVPLS